jgi:hypothetical protein
MKTTVFRVSCFAGLPTNRTPQTPVKKATVHLTEEALQKTPNPQDKAKYLARQIWGSEIEKDPHFSDCHWEVEATEVDLSEYVTPNLTSSDGKAWRN